MLRALVRPAAAAVYARNQCRVFDYKRLHNSRPFKMAEVLQSSNPLLDQSGLPKFALIEASHVEPAITHLLEQLSTNFSALEDELKTAEQPTYSQTIERLEAMRNPVEYAWGVVGHLLAVKNSDELRTAHETMQPAVVQAFQRLGQSKALFDSLNKIKQGAEWANLDGSQKRIIEASLRDMRLSGIALPDEQREIFNKLTLEGAELSTKFNNNVLDSTKAVTFELTTKEEVEGLPESALALAAQTARSKGHESATTEDGPWVITLDIPSYLPCMQHLKRQDIRERIYRAYISRASSGDSDNTGIIQKVLTARKHKSRMLGFNTFAEMSLASKMAPSYEAVDNLINMLRDNSFEPAREEFAKVQEFARSKGFEGDLQLWDVTYWSERQREELYGFKEEELRPYFPLPAVLDGLFGLANRLFGVVIRQANGEADIWHPDVQFFHVVDEASGEQIASFFLDPYSRPENKRGGAWMDVCIQRSKVLDRKPVAYLTCNGSPPVGDIPSLMTFREVETLFHEFGHGLQHMLTKVEHGDAAGINGVEWDAVELPSQFMENWCYDRPTLYGFAKHYKTGEPLPEELFQKLNAQRNYNAGMAMLRQLFFGRLDMELHHNYDPEDSSHGTPFEIQQRISSDYTVLRPLPEDRFLCTFAHIFAGGYAAGYYSYKWAEVMSADAFAAFEEAGLDNDEAVREVGRRFRETVLALGGGTHPSEVYRAFRGRDPSPEALLRHSGLSNLERIGTAPN